MHENRETWSASAAQSGGRPVGEGQGQKTHRHAGQESDSGVVPMKGSNQGGQPTAESLEGVRRAVCFDAIHPTVHFSLLPTGRPAVIHAQFRTTMHNNP
jgi:hypothetical protein